MNILEALARLRDDIKTWVANNLNSLNDNMVASDKAIKALIGDKSVSEQISEAIKEESFSGDYDDLTNAPIINDENGNFIITDEQNNKILEINKDGLYTTNVFSDGINLKTTIENNKAEQNAKNANLEEKIQDIITNIDNLPFQDLDGENFIVADNNGNKIAEFNQTGFHTTDIFFKPNPEASEETNLQDALDNISKTTDDAIDEVEARINILEAYDKELQEIIKDSGDGAFILTDDKDNKILQVDGNGLRTTKIIFKPEANGAEIDLHAALKKADEVRAEVYGTNGSADGSRIDSLEAADSALDKRIDTLESAVGENGAIDERINAAKTELTGKIATAKNEANTYTDTKTKKVQDNLDNEIAARTAADSALKQELSESITSESQEWTVLDENQNVIMKVDSRGVATYDLLLGDIANNQSLQSIGTIIDEKVNTAKEYADTKDNKVREEFAAADNAIEAKVNKLIGSDADKSARTIANEELAAQLLHENGAVDNFKTLKELAAWLEQHPEDAAVMNANILDVRKEVYGTADGSAADPSRIDTNASNIATINSKITAMKLADTAVAKQFVSEVDQTDGKITVTRRALVAADVPNHKSTATTFGVGDNDEYGHLKLSDEINSDSSTNGGIAATPKAVANAVAKAASDIANAKTELSESITSESQEWTVLDKNQNVILKVDENGVSTYDLYYNNGTAENIELVSVKDKILELDNKTASANLVVEAIEAGTDADGNNLVQLVNITFEEMEAAANAGRMIILKFGIFFANMTFHASSVMIFETKVEGSLNAQIRFSAEDGNIGTVTNRIIFDNWISEQNEGKFLKYNDGYAEWVTPPNATTTTPGYMSPEDKVKLEGIAPSVMFSVTPIAEGLLTLLDDDFNPIQLSVNDLADLDVSSGKISLRILAIDGIDLCYADFVGADEDTYTFKFSTGDFNGSYYAITIVPDMSTGYLIPTYEKKSLNIEGVVYHGETDEGEGTLPSEIALEDLMPKAGGRFTGAVEYTTLTGGNITSSGIITANQVYGAVWNDYAEFRQATEDVEPGHVVCENGDDTVSLSIKRMQPGAMMVSDTYGFAIGETNKCKCPIAVAGRVLMYPYEKREKYKSGDAVCSGPNGTVSKMSRLETFLFPDRIIGTVSSIPNYEFWGEKNIEVKNRIWIKAI